MSSPRKRSSQDITAASVADLLLPISVTLDCSSSYQRDEDHDDEYDEGEDESSPAITRYSAKIWQGHPPQQQVVIGKATVVLVDRARTTTTLGGGRSSGSDFHRVCDEDSGELEGAAAFICDKSGQAHHRLSIHGHDDTPRGGFLYLEVFQIDEDYRRHHGRTMDDHDDNNDTTGVGAMALRALLNHPTLIQRWSLAVYIPDCQPFLTEAELSTLFHSSFGHDDEGRNETRAQQQARHAATVRGCQQDARQFFRAGFRQVTPPSLLRGDMYHLFAVPSFVKEDVSTMISHEEALVVPIIDAPKRPLPPVGVDLELVMCSGHGGWGLDPPVMDWKRFESQVQTIIARGGAIERSTAIHFCARHGKVKELEVLLRLAGTKAMEAINAPNEQGLTPLMEAAIAATSSVLLDSYRFPVSPVGICDTLLAWGADKEARDVIGLTALGHMRNAAVTRMEWAGGYHAAMTKLAALTKLLMPLTGPSLADNAMLSAAQIVPAGWHDYEVEDY